MPQSDTGPSAWRIRKSESSIMARINVKQLRDDMGLSLPKMAEQLGVHARTIQRWESAESDPSPLATEKLRALHKAHTERKNGTSTGTSTSTRTPADDLPEPLRGLLPSLR